MNMQDPQIAALIAALHGSGSLDQSDALLGQQANQANQSFEGAASRPAYGAGAGIGQGLTALFSGIHGSQIANDQKANLGKRDSYIDALLKALQGPATGAAQGAPAGIAAQPDQSWTQGMGVKQGDFAGSYSPQTGPARKPLSQMNPLEIEAAISGGQL